MLNTPNGRVGTALAPPAVGLVTLGGERDSSLNTGTHCCPGCTLSTLVPMRGGGYDVVNEELVVDAELTTELWNDVVWGRDSLFERE